MNWTRSARVSGPRRNHARPRVEELETRIVPYALTGYTWPHPELVSISFVPDGTNLGGVTSNLFATFNAKLGSAAVWQNQILKAAQTWAQQTNINFTFVGDNGTDSGSGSYEQGDPNMGDIRIGGFNFGLTNGALAVADWSPQGNNYSVGGDITFNTGQPFNIGSTYDLYTVALHEFGHALGLDHSSSSAAVMYSTYSGAVTGLNSDDIAGIRNIYSNGNARSPDAYDAAASNGSFSTASNISAQINTSTLTALVTNLDITTTADVDWYKFTAPKGSSSTLTVTVQSDGLSLLAPVLSVYNSSETKLTSASGAGQYGTTITATVTGIKAGATYYVKVDGADNTQMGTGAYALVLNLGSGSSPSVPLPNTTTADGNPLHDSGGAQYQTPIGSLLGLVFDLLGGIFAGWGDAYTVTGAEAPDAAAVAHRDAVPAVAAAPPSPAPAAGLLPVGPIAPVVSPLTTAFVPVQPLGLPGIWVETGLQIFSGTANGTADDPVFSDPAWDDAVSCPVGFAWTTPAAAGSGRTDNDAGPRSDRAAPARDSESPATHDASIQQTPSSRADETSADSWADFASQSGPVASPAASVEAAPATSVWQAVEACFAEFADLFAW
jgi:hypothetical protein